MVLRPLFAAALVVRRRYFIMVPSQAAARGVARYASQVLDRGAQADARGATNILDRGVQAVARGAARLAPPMTAAADVEVLRRT